MIGRRQSRGMGASLLLAAVFAGAQTGAQTATQPQVESSAAPSKGERGAAKKAAAPPAADASSPFRITGRVVDSLSNAPVARAEIAVSPMGARRRNGRFAGRAGGSTATAVADGGGRFAVEVPSAGGWSLSASAHGYHTQAFEENDIYSTAVILSDANPTYNLTFRLTPAAAIDGYVLDEAGEAVRNAQLTLSLVPPPTPDEQHPRQQARGNQRTDDRGYYKFSGLLTGSYDLRLQAQPWYATNIGNGGGPRFGDRFGGEISFEGRTSAAGSPDSSTSDPLDVVYPTVWFPGVTDFAAATPIVLRGGETREADFRLAPIPGFHLRIGGGDGRNGAYLSQVLPEGTESPVPLPSKSEANGATEFSGLAPGTYVVHRQGEPEDSSAATIKIAGNSARTVDMGQATPPVPVTVKTDGPDVPALQISFRNMESGHVTFVQGHRESGAMGQRRERAADAVLPATSEAAPDRSVSLQPGRYEVVLNGVGDMRLASIEAAGATATGRTVTITQGAPTLTLHLARGRANVTGTVTLQGKPLEGAMVLLVPATLGDASGINIMRRDQSNTDGSFDMTGVLPGAYILLAIDHGWDVNWSVPAALQRFLMNGLPLDLSTLGDTKKVVEAQMP